MKKLICFFFISSSLSSICSAQLPVIESYPEKKINHIDSSYEFTSPKPILPSPNFDNELTVHKNHNKEQDLDLSQESDTEKSTQISNYNSCVPKLPNNAPFGITQNLRKNKDICQIANYSQQIATLALNANKLLFCKDLSNSKSMCQANYETYQNNLNIAKKLRSQALETNKNLNQTTNKNEFALLNKINIINKNDIKIPDGWPLDHNIPAYPSANQNLEKRFFDQEAKICSNFDKLANSIFPFITAIDILPTKSDKSCMAIIAKVTVSSGRFFNNSSLIALGINNCKDKIIGPPNAEQLALSLEDLSTNQKYMEVFNKEFNLNLNEHFHINANICPVNSF